MESVPTPGTPWFENQGWRRTATTTIDDASRGTAATPFFEITFLGLTSMSAADWKCQDWKSLMQTRRIGLSVGGVVDSVVDSVVD